MSQEEVKEPIKGDGYSVAHLDGLGEGYGFRKIRRGLDVEEFGANAIVMPPNYAAPAHFHDEQEELYFVHQGTIEMTFGDGSTQRLGPGGLARVAAATHRKVANVGEDDAVFVIVGAKGGYIGRDGHAPDAE